ncbi:MAG: outer membrane lipoprotein-sorting protein [Deltaproteobacteria bacterium]|nr:outer membrane lipoprotein-sorting protein [Deltaproteobacteria bacterium]
MMNRTTLTLLAALLATPLVAPPPASAEDAPAAAPAEEMTVQQILDAIDANMVFESRTTKIKMTVEGKKRTRTFEMISYGRGKDDSAMEYVTPAREKGTKMLKLGDDMWMYLPSVDRTQKISGHMLRKGMMGSDLSYDDMMTTEQMAQMYTPTLLGSEDIDGRPAWKIELVANDESVAYPKRLQWVDKELFIPVQQELFALSGMKLKSWRMGKIKEFEGGRQFPTWMEIVDEVKSDSKTTLEFGEMTFGVELESEIFSQRWLERK